MNYLNNIANGFLTALFFSLFIYLEYFNINAPWLNLLSALIAFYRILNAPRKEVIYSGFFIGIFWFYWVSFSFRFYYLTYLIPLAILGFALAYSLFFYILAYSKSPFVRTIILIILSFIEPFGFNWFKVELLLINTPVVANTLTLTISLVILSLSIQYSKKFLALLAILFFIPQISSAKLQDDIKIKLISTDVSQHKKWLHSHKNLQITNNLNEIKIAIEENADLVVLPESVFPLYLNKELNLINELKYLSQEIAIISGGLYLENSQIYNATYYFNKNEIQIAKKMILVPFGEYIPLPKFLKDFINNVFYNGAQDYEKADKPTDFILNGVSLRNAICYEATSKELFTGSPAIMIASSNNAWFTPSIEPTLQKLLMKYYARLHNTVIYHSSNSDGSGIIK